MKSREDYPFWFYFDDYDEDDQGYEKEINWIDFEEEEDERDFDNTESFDDLMECAREQDEAGMKVAKGFMGY